MGDTVGYLCSIWGAFLICLIISTVIMTYLSRLVNKVRDQRRVIFERWQNDLEKLDDQIDEKLDDLSSGGDDDEDGDNNGDAGGDGATKNVNQEQTEKEILKNLATQIEMQ